MISDRVATREPTVAAWTVSWSGIWIGAFSAVVAIAMLGFAGTALGAQMAGSEGRLTSWNSVGPMALAWAVFSSFLSFALAGWVAARIAGIRRAEDAALHGAIAFVVGAVILLAMASFGAAFMSGWYAGLAPAPVGSPAGPGAPVDPNAAAAARNSALAAATALLVGLMGGVIGGWMASNEPMTIRGMPRVRIDTERRLP